MPIGGGTFTLQNKVLPGVYMNFVSASGGVSAGSRGIASIPAELGWGAEDTIIRMDSGDFNRQAVTVFGYDATAPELLLIREAFKRAKTLLVYRVDGGGSKATKEIAGRYGGLENLGEKLMKSENFEMAIGEIVWLITLLANQSILVHNLKDKEHPKELLTEDVVELLTTPLDLAGYKTAITEALYKGTKRNVESEKDAKNAPVG